ncbi:MAG TPA: NAD(P)/FAD-dependent oxidoreductase [Methylomirabilota bacterium]|nr:NAD(P)/FAD-dependent oxidoreductase [Methylomirabilota bacterium]
MKSGHSRMEFDVAVLGAGSAGYAAARTTAAAGLRTVVLEGGREVGGLCILRGCMPTKALLHAAEVLHLSRRAPVWGVYNERTTFDFDKVMARKNALIREFADYRAGQLQDGRFDFIRSTARFLDPRTLALADGRRLRAQHFVIATGSVVAPPPVAGLAETGFITSDDALALTRLPRSLIILGGGAVAVEFAQLFARFGTRVTLVQRSSHILKQFDADATGTLEEVFRREGIDVYTDTRLIEARREGGAKAVIFHQAGRTVRVEAEEILHALGRVPNTADLGLEHAGVKTRGGRILTDEQMRTTAPHIYAAGDCAGPHEIVHIAIQQGEIAAHNIARPESPRGIDYRLLISVVFTEPQLATVGLTEQEARARGISFLVASYPFNDHGKSLIMEARDGFVKLLADPTSGEILGGACAGPLGGELIHEIVVAMARRMTVTELAAVPHYHPTLAEIWTYPAEELAGQIPAARAGRNDTKACS